MALRFWLGLALLLGGVGWAVAAHAGYVALVAIGLVAMIGASFEELL